MEIRSYKTGDEQQILELFELSFGKKMSKEYWNWRFLNNPFQEEPLIDLMWDADKLVGHYAVSPIDMFFDGKRVKTALSMTTMTHPEYGGRGIFSQLASCLYNRLHDNGFSMVWGFPNNNSHYGFNKNLQWKNVAVQAIMNVSGGVVEKKLTSESCVEIHRFDKVHADLLQGDETVRINKGPEFLNWRYFDNPSSDYRALMTADQSGLIIYKVISSFSDPTKNEIDIMNFEFSNNLETLQNLISHIYKNERSIVKFNLWDSIFSKNQLILEKFGFRIGAPITYLGCRVFDNSAAPADFRNWEINFGYSDVF